MNDNPLIGFIVIILVAPFVMPWRGCTSLLLRCTIAQRSVCGEIFF